jgi:membrane protein
LTGDAVADPILGAPTHGWRVWWAITRSAVSAWIDDYAPSMGAALSYYTVFSLAPLLLIVISVAGLVFGEEAVRGELFAQLQQLMGSEAASAVQSLLVSVSKPSHGVVGTAIGVAVLLFGATTVFGELQDALDRIWRVPARQTSSGLWSLLRARLLSFGLILGLAFLLMVSLVFGAVISALGRWWGPVFGGWEVAAQIVNELVGFGLATAVFAFIYRFMPRVSVRWHDVWLGALITAVLFTVGKFLIGLYIGKSGIASAFGAAGSLVVIFVWVYYSAQIFLVGAEFTWVYARTLGSRRDLAEPARAATDRRRRPAPTRSEGSTGTSVADTPPLADEICAAAGAERPGSPSAPPDGPAVGPCRRS